VENSTAFHGPFLEGFIFSGQEMVTRRLMALESLEATVEVQLRSYLEARVDQSRGNGHQRQGMIGMLWLLNTPKKMPNWGEISPATAEKYHLNILK
jgi:hypothetical protein